jgi:TonB family protein
VASHSRTDSCRSSNGIPVISIGFYTGCIHSHSDRMVSAMNKAAIRSDWVGRVIDGRFPLLMWLGGSQWSGVFLTQLQDSQQKASIKLIPADAPDAKAHSAGWAAASTLTHPHLMRLFHTGSSEIDSIPFLYSASEYSDENLAQILPERPLTPAEAREMLDPVLDALSYLHAKGFVQGHLKPSNILVVGNQVKLSSDTLYLAGRLGIPLPEDIYSAPEMAANSITAASDIWSLGITLVEALTQHPPSWNKSSQREPLVPDSIPQPFADIARECLRSEPARRCTLGYIRFRLNPDSLLPQVPCKPTEWAPARLRVPILILAALIVCAAIVFSLMRIHLVRPSSTAATQPPVPADSPRGSPAASPPGPSHDAALKGAVAQNVLPKVPQSALRTIHGTVDVKIGLKVDSAGNVSNVKIESPGPSRYFANLALKAARSWRFNPAQSNGHPIPSVWTLVFKFRQTGIEVSPIETAPR